MSVALTCAKKHAQTEAARQHASGMGADSLSTTREKARSNTRATRGSTRPPVPPNRRAPAGTAAVWLSAPPAPPEMRSNACWATTPHIAPVTQPATMSTGALYHTSGVPRRACATKSCPASCAKAPMTDTIQSLIVRSLESGAISASERAVPTAEYAMVMGDPKRSPAAKILIMATQQAPQMSPCASASSTATLARPSFTPGMGMGTKVSR